MPRRYSKPGPRTLLTWLLLLALGGIVALSRAGLLKPPRRHVQRPAAEVPDANSLHRVSRVIDGDTVSLADGTRVRLLGIDCPEAPRDGKAGEPFWREATETARGLCEGKAVQLRYGAEQFDGYGRVLAYVIVDGVNVNAELLRLGLAEVYRKADHPRRSEFFRLEKDARAERLGIWSIDDAE